MVRSPARLGVVLRLAKGHKPGRPVSRTLKDSDWNLIQDCWSPIEERPAAEAIISSIEQSLNYCPRSPPLCDLLGSWSGQADLGAESSLSLSQASTEGSDVHVASDRDEVNQTRYVVIIISIPVDHIDTSESTLIRILSFSEASGSDRPQGSEQRRTSPTGKQPRFRLSTADTDMGHPHKKRRV